MVLFPFLSYFFGSEISKDNGPSMSVFNTLHSLFPCGIRSLFLSLFPGAGGRGWAVMGELPFKF